MTSTTSGAAESWAASPAPDGGSTAGRFADEADDYYATPGGRADEAVAGSAPYWSDDADWHSPGDNVTYVTGISGRGLILLSGVAVGACTLLDLVLTGGRLTFFFDLCFVVLCLISTMAVRRSDLFTAGVLPPLLYAGVIAALSVLAPDAFDAGSGAGKVFLTGLADHAGGLVSGYGVALATVAARVASTSPRHR